MKRLQTILSILFCVVCLTSTHPIKPEKAVLINLINNLRQKGCSCGKQQFKSVSPLSKHEQLTQSAERHLRDMLENQSFSHIGTDGSSMATRISATGYRWASIAENIAQHQPSETKVLDYWKTQNGDCKNLLNPHFQHIGIAHAERIWVVCLGSPLP